MTKAELEAYRRRLLALGRRVGREMSELEQEALRGAGGEASGNLSSVPVHPADLGTDNFEEEVSIGLLENQDQLRTAIDDALRRIERGTFGRCENCGQGISRQRLDALPYARHCITCARQLQGPAGR
ncbi:MAG TPA: TraR/DksA C4-type zinc finger protein [Gemmataceae bacterium]|nr:TraR/DksA C4-type zinc finger protein [Gemmataceae bacterium]